MDAEIVASLLGELGYHCSPDDAARRLAEYATAGTRVFLADSSSEIVGFISLHCIPLIHEDGFLGRITALIVAPAHRGNGIGTQLVRFAEEYAWEYGCSRIEVTSGDHRTDTHGFYKALGYQENCRRFLSERAKSV